MVCNPVVTTPADAEPDDDEEGCLSYPGAYVELVRPGYAAVDGLGREQVGRPGEQASTKQTNLADNCDFSQPPPRWACGSSMGNKTPDKIDGSKTPVRTLPAGPTIIPRLIN